MKARVICAAMCIGFAMMVALPVVSAVRFLAMARSVLMGTATHDSFSRYAETYEQYKAVSVGVSLIGFALFLPSLLLLLRERRGRWGSGLNL